MVRVYILLLFMCSIKSIEVEKSLRLYHGFVGSSVHRDVVLDEARKAKYTNKLINTWYDTATKTLLWHKLPRTVQYAVQERYYTSEYQRYADGCKKKNKLDGSQDMLYKFRGIAYKENHNLKNLVPNVREYMPLFVLLKDLHAAGAVPHDVLNSIVKKCCFTKYSFSLYKIGKGFDKETFQASGTSAEITALAVRNNIVVVGDEKGLVKRIGQFFDDPTGQSDW